MMTESVQNDYQVSSEGAVRHWEVPYARMEDTTPTPTQPAALTSLLVGTQVCGTVLTIDAGDSIAVVDFTCSMVYRQSVRNVLDYAGNAENSWGAINIGDIIYYDGGTTMVALGLKLSTSPLDAEVAANPRFGWAVAWSDADMANFPKGGVTASTQTIAVMQIGAAG